MHFKEFLAGVFRKYLISQQFGPPQTHTHTHAHMHTHTQTHLRISIFELTITPGLGRHGRHEGPKSLRPSFLRLRGGGGRILLLPALIVVTQHVELENGVPALAPVAWWAGGGGGFGLMRHQVSVSHCTSSPHPPTPSQPYPFCPPVLGFFSWAMCYILVPALCIGTTALSQSHTHTHAVLVCWGISRSHFIVSNTITKIQYKIKRPVPVPETTTQFTASTLCRSTEA